MIYPDDAKDFSTMMDVTWQSLGRNHLDKETKKYWFSKLQHLPLATIESAFDSWLMTSEELPTIKQIIALTRPKEDFHKALGVVRSEEISQEGIKKINAIVSDSMKPKTDHKAWARKILNAPNAYLDIAVKYAREALRA